MMRQIVRQAAIFSLLAGLLLRAVTPLGYMPAAGIDGPWFELCPEQMPIAFAGASTSGHVHHHHGAEPGQETQSDADLCQVGHLLFTGVAADTDTLAVVSQQFDSPLAPAAISFGGSRFTSGYQSRAPPV